MRQARVELGLQKGEEKIEEVNAETVSDNVPSLSNNYAKKE